ncbi:Uncharacterised protein [Mycobacteroides abscessus subsp. abscessus]|nr:Uncharacterised protein [Mycobacteroides abscessus subsp. abscessus]
MDFLPIIRVEVKSIDLVAFHLSVLKLILVCLKLLIMGILKRESFQANRLKVSSIFDNVLLKSFSYKNCRNRTKLYKEEDNTYNIRRN